MKALAPFVVLVVAACGRPADFQGPAPEGALQCSLAYAEAAGYEVVEGGVDAGFLRLVQRLNPEPRAPGQIQPPTSVPVSGPGTPERTPENELLVEVDRGRLHLTVVSLAEPETRDIDGSTAEDQARTMLAMCTNTPPVFPPAG